jgi:hypothetical protein
VKTWSMAAVAALAISGIVAASYLSLNLLVTAVALVIVVVAAGWPHLLEVPARKTLSTVIALSGLAAVAAALLAPAGSLLMWLPTAVALGVAAVFVVQLLRGTGQSYRLESTLGAATGVLLAGMGSGWVAADRLAHTATPGMMLVTGLSMLVALAVCEIPWPDRIVAPLAVVMAALAGALAAALFAGVPPAAAAAVATAGAAVLASFRRLILAGKGPGNWLAALSLAGAPVLAIGSLVYFIDKLLLA